MVNTVRTQFPVWRQPRSMFGGRFGCTPQETQHSRRPDQCPARHTAMKMSLNPVIEIKATDLLSL